MEKNHYVLVHTSDKGREVWRIKGNPEHAGIRIWPVGDPTTGDTYYKCQDGFLHTWTMTGPEHLEALQNGLDHAG